MPIKSSRLKSRYARFRLRYFWFSHLDQLPRDVYVPFASGLRKVGEMGAPPISGQCSADLAMIDQKWVVLPSRRPFSAQMRTPPISGQCSADLAMIDQKLSRKPN